MPPENKKDDDASKDDQEELSDEEVDKLVQFKAPSYFIIYDHGAGGRTVHFFK